MRCRILPVLAFAAFGKAGTILAPVQPPRLVYATYVSKGPGSVIAGLAVDSGGFAYLPGGGPAQGGPRCAFLTKLNQSGTDAVWSVCLPMYQVKAVALDASGFIYVVGDNQPDPSTPPYSASLLKLSPDAQSTIYSRTMMGARASKMALDNTGNVYVVGAADSTFRPTAGAYAASGGAAYVLKVSASDVVEYAAILDLAAPGDIAVNSKGQAWVVGSACPSGRGLLSNCDATAGTASAIRELDANGAALLFSQTFGGGRPIVGGPAAEDKAQAVAVDANDAVWLVGYADASGVPITPNAIQPTRLGLVLGALGYALKLSSSGDLLYGSYIESAPHFSAQAISAVAIDDNCRPYFALNSLGQMFSTVMALSADGSLVLLSSPMLGEVDAITLDGNGGLYASGTSGLIYTTPGAYQSAYPGGSASGFAAKFDLTSSSTSPYNKLLNAAALARDAAMVAPGEIMTLFGSFATNPAVMFDGIRASILYFDNNQVNFVVPFEVSPPSTTFWIDGQSPVSLEVSPAFPRIFTADESGSGSAAALNQDSSVNSTTNPALAGSAISLYLSGAGAEPFAVDGQIGSLQPPFLAPSLPITATVNGVSAPVLFAGQAPGWIAGAVQVNLQIPAGTLTGDANVVVSAGSYSSLTTGVTIAVKGN